MSTVQKWKSKNGDLTYRLNYDLNNESVVIDAGGYEGWFAEQIYNKYKCKVYVFEPVKEFYDNIVEKFKGNENIKVFHCGLGSKKQTLTINLQRDGTSVHTNKGKHFKGNTEEISLISILDFLNDNNIKDVDLLKLNIEGEEFNLLECLIDKNELDRFFNIQVQFHSFIDNADERRYQIRESLKESFSLEYDYPFVWEGWKQI